MATYTVRTQTGGTKTFETQLTMDQAAQTVMDNIEGVHVLPWSAQTRQFVTDLVHSYRQFGPRLSLGRQAWLLKFGQEVLDAAQRQIGQTIPLAQPVQAPPCGGPTHTIPPFPPGTYSTKPQLQPGPALPTAPAPRPVIGNFSDIVAIFQTAAKHLKYPRIILRTAQGQNVALQVATVNSRYPGAIHVSDGIRKSAGGKYFGRIDTDGTLDTRYPNQDVINLLQRFAADPAAVAAEYGKLTGACCFCKMPLTDPRSTDVGYGPICSEHFGLPWGNKRQPLPVPHGDLWGDNPEQVEAQAQELFYGAGPSPALPAPSSPDAADDGSVSAAPAGCPFEPSEPALAATPAAGSDAEGPEDSPEQTPAAPLVETHHKCTNPDCSMHNRLFQATAPARCSSCGQLAQVVDSSIFTVQVPTAGQPAHSNKSTATQLKPNFPLGVSKPQSSTPRPAVLGATPKPRPTTDVLTTDVRGTLVYYQLLDYPHVRFHSANSEWDAEYKRTTGSTMESCSPHELLQFIRWIYNRSN